MRIAALTHVGLRRQRNEDCIAVGRQSIHEPLADPWLTSQPLDTPFACLVADGMGGHPAGDVASRFVIEHLSNRLNARTTDAAGLVEAIRDANRSLFSEMERIPALYGMGTTIAGLVAHPAGLYAFTVGDSRVYRRRNSRIEQVGHDDTVQICAPPFSGRKASRVLSQCLGGFSGAEQIEPHITQLPLEAGAEFLICSDGLHDMLSDSEIERCIDADQAATVMALFEHAMRAGGIDNISIIHARIESDTEVDADA